MEAELITGDLSENTMTFEVKGEMVLKAGNYIIIDKKDFINNEDLQHLKWIYERMVNQHNENWNYDYMYRFAKIMQKLDETK